MGRPHKGFRPPHYRLIARTIRQIGQLREKPTLNRADVPPGRRDVEAPARRDSPRAEAPGGAKRDARGDRRLRPLLLQRMAAIESATFDMGRLVPPRREHVVERAHRTAATPDGRQRGADPGVGGIVHEIDGCGGAIVLADGMPGGGIPIAPQRTRRLINSSSVAAVMRLRSRDLQVT
jgi:hypothetical protein